MERRSVLDRHREQGAGDATNQPFRVRAKQGVTEPVVSARRHHEETFRERLVLARERIFKASRGHATTNAEPLGHHTEIWHLALANMNERDIHVGDFPVRETSRQFQCVQQPSDVLKRDAHRLRIASGDKDVLDLHKTCRGAREARPIERYKERGRACVARDRLSDTAGEDLHKRAATMGTDHDELWLHAGQRIEQRVGRVVTACMHHLLVAERHAPCIGEPLRMGQLTRRDSLRGIDRDEARTGGNGERRRAHERGRLIGSECGGEGDRLNRLHRRLHDTAAFEVG